MPSERDILLEDGTVWDGSDPEESWLCRRIRLCQSCQSIMATPERIRALQAEGIPICTGSEGGGFTCSIRAIALIAAERYNHRQMEYVRRHDPSDYASRGLPQMGLVKDGSLRGFKFTAYPGKGHDIKTLTLEKPDWVREVQKFDIYTLPDDPAAEYVSTRPVTEDVANESAQQIHSWLDTCRRDHKKCQQPRDARLPTRIVDVGLGPGTNEVDMVWIRETRREVGKYTALSYCWGGDQPVRLLKEAYRQMTSMPGIEMRMLPQTIQDAVRLTRKLGLQSLWVDALCIVQNDDDDKQHELGQMALVYKNAYITISAASARTCFEGFLHHRRRRPSPYPRFELPFRAADDAPTGTVVVQEHSPFYAFDEPINRRAWCLQESLLSPRLVIFGSHELLWQCGFVTCNEPLIAGGPGHSIFEGTERLNAAFFQDPAPSRGLARSTWADSWSDIVINYSQRATTHESDRLVALSGLASEHQRLSGGDTYVAGLWRRDLAGPWLQWLVDPAPQRRSGPQRLRPRPAAYVAPSWSWASVNGVISYGSGGGGLAPEDVLRCDVTLADERLPTGAVTAGVLVLRARVRETRWEGQGLLASAAPGAERIGYAFMDADEERPEVVSCAALWGASFGLILVRNSDTGTYSRVGYFEIREYPMEGKEWFAGYEPQVITLV